MDELDEAGKRLHNSYHMNRHDVTRVRTIAEKHLRRRMIVSTSALIVGVLAFGGVVSQLDNPRNGDSTASYADYNLDRQSAEAVARKHRVEIVRAAMAVTKDAAAVSRLLGIEIRSTTPEGLLEVQQLQVKSSDNPNETNYIVAVVFPELLNTSKEPVYSAINSSPINLEEIGPSIQLIPAINAPAGG